MLTRAAPVASAARSEASSRMPPESSTVDVEPPDHRRRAGRRWSRGRTRRRGRPGGPTRAPPACQASAASSGSPYAVSMPAAPCTSRTAWPSATSTAGSRVSVTASSPSGRRSAPTSTGSNSSVSNAERDPDRPVRHQVPDHARRARPRPRPTTSALARAAPRRTARPAGARAGPTAGPATAAPSAAGPGARRDAGPLALAATAASGLALGPPPGPLLAHCADPTLTGYAASCASSVRAGVARLLRVELGGRQRCPLDRGHERSAVDGGGDRRTPSSAAPGGRRTSGRSRTARRPGGRRTAPSRPARATVFQPMCGTRSARPAGSPRRAAGPGPWSPRRARRRTRTGSACRRRCRAPAAGRDPVGDHRAGAERLDPGHAGGVRPDAGHDQAVGGRRPRSGRR